VRLVPIAYPIRLAVAVTLVAWGGLTSRRWTVPLAAGLAIPALYVWSFLPLWLGVLGVEWPQLWQRTSDKTHQSAGHIVEGLSQPQQEGIRTKAAPTALRRMDGG
jgi:hypothetical protein